MHNNTCIVIVGPTAVGKTAIAIQVAKQFGTQIISCDSRQCFTELNIGVARPSPAELIEVQHYFISSHSIQQTVNAAVFEQYALEKVNAIFSKKTVAVMVGGTGLYANAFCNGIDEVPVVDMAIRKKIIESYQTNGIEWLQTQLQQLDGKFYSHGEMQNPQRMMRALEVKLSTGRSIFDYHSNQKKQRDFNIIKVGIELPRKELVHRINSRVDIMMAEGLEKEVQSLLPYRHLNALQTVGYKELFGFFDNSCTLQQAIESIKINTRHYAKRQMTWFKKDKEIRWCTSGFSEAMAAIDSGFKMV